MKHSVIRALLLLLALVMAVGVFTACGDDEEPPAPINNADTLAAALKDYKLVGPLAVMEDAKDPDFAAGISAIEAVMKEINGKDLAVGNDRVKRGETVPSKNKEILIDATNRASSQTAHTTLTANRPNNGKDYSIQILDGEVVIVGGSSEAIKAACLKFAEMLREAATTYPVGRNITHLHTYDAETFAGKQVSAYKIVVGAGASDVIKDAATKLQKEVFDKYGCRLPIIKDSTGKEGPEFVVGNTSREATAVATASMKTARANCAKDTCLQAMPDGSVGIVGGYEPAVVAAVDHCAAQFLKADYKTNAPANYHYQDPSVIAVNLLGKTTDQYNIIIAQDAPLDIRYEAWKLQQFFLEKAGYAINIKTDKSAQGTSEILIGATGRPQSGSYSLGNYVAKEASGNVVFNGGNYYDAVTAVENFIKLCEGYTTATNVTATMLAQNGNTLSKTGVATSWTNNGSAATFINTYFPEYASTLDAASKNGTFALAWNEEFTRIGDEQINTMKLHDGGDTMNRAGVISTFNRDVVNLDGEGNLVLTNYICNKAGQIDRTGSTWVKGSVDNRYMTNNAIASFGTMNYIYGYLEMRAKIPSFGKGEFPSFWLMSGSTTLHDQYYQKTYGVARNSVANQNMEIDVFEVFSDSVSLHPNIHKWYRSGTPWHEARKGASDQIPKPVGSSPKYTYTRGEVYNNFHTYGFLWTKDLMAFAVDGNFYYAHPLAKDFGTSAGGQTSGMKEFGARVYDGGSEIENRYVGALALMLNNYCFSEAYVKSPAGSWTSSSTADAIDPSIFPYTYTVDYIRLYQIDNYGLNDDMKLFTKDFPLEIAD